MPSRRSLLVLSVIVVLSGFLVVCDRPDAMGARQRPTGSAASALTADECSYFDVGGKVRICHATASGRYTILQVSDSACVDGHATHPLDYVATDTDLDCHGGGCFPEGAPVDPTIPCCDGLVDVNGFCTSCAPDGGTCATTDGGGTCTTADGGACVP